MTATAQAIVVALGIAMGLASLWGIVATAPLLAAVRGVLDKVWGMPFAVAVRIMLGIALLFAAPASKFPALFNWLGFLALIAAAALPVIGRPRIIALLDWFYGLPGFVIRLWLICGLLFGVFMVYGAISPG